jgi:hypothetical protein
MKTRPNITKASRLDAADSYFLSQQLESLDPTTYYELFAGRIGRRFIPAIDNIAPFDTTYKYSMVHFKGSAKKGGPKAKDHRTVTVVKTEVTQSIKKIPVSYGWTVDEIRASRAKGLNLDSDSLQAAVGSVEQEIDNMLAFGDTQNANITGLLNNTNILDTTPTTKTGAGTSWLGSAVLPGEIIKDVTKMIGEAREALKQANEVGTGMPAFAKFSLLLPQQHMSVIASTPRSDNSDTTILQWLLQNNPWLASVEDWWQLDEADDGDPMAVLYPALPTGVLHPRAGGAIIPVDFESLDPQFSGHDVVVPASGSCGGVAVRYPVGFRYMYGL